MRFSEKGVTFSLAKLTNTPKPEVLFYLALSTDKKVCPVFTSMLYIHAMESSAAGMQCVRVWTATMLVQHRNAIVAHRRWAWLARLSVKHVVLSVKPQYLLRSRQTSII